MHKFIHNEEELRWYHRNVLPRLGLYETYFLSLSARNKQLSKEEREYLQLGRTEMLERKSLTTNNEDFFVKYDQLKLDLEQSMEMWENEHEELETWKLKKTW